MKLKEVVGLKNRKPMILANAMNYLQQEIFHKEPIIGNALNSIGSAPSIKNYSSTYGTLYDRSSPYVCKIIYAFYIR